MFGICLLIFKESFFDAILSLKIFQYQKNGKVELLRNLCKTQRMQAWYGLEWAIRRILKPIAIAMGEKANEIDRPSPCHECD
jgi:hypothetical protein